MNIENKNLLPVITSENDVYPYLKKIILLLHMVYLIKGKLKSTKIYLGIKFKGQNLM